MPAPAAEPWLTPMLMPWGSRVRQLPGVLPERPEAFPGGRGRVPYGHRTRPGERTRVVEPGRRASRRGALGRRGEGAERGPPPPALRTRLLEPGLRPVPRPPSVR